MIPNANKQVHHVGNVLEEFEMTIDQSRAGQIAIMRQMRRDLYSDQMLAPIRELSTNAWDSHLEAGNPAPFEATLPTPTHPTFSAIDHGLGLSVDDIKNTYSVFGSSTKRLSDEMTGMLGYGSKSPLAYALSFTGDAVKGGVRTLFMVTVNEDDVGTVKILDTSATDAPNGVTISMPVKAHDVATFRSKALAFYSYWKPGTVLVDGAAPAHVAVDLFIDGDVAVLRGKPEASRLVMGGVAYPFRPDFKHGIVAWVPMGSIDFTPSRESLQMNDLTRETIRDVTRFTRERLGVKILEAMESAPSPFERAKVLAGWRYENEMTKAQAAKVKAHGVALAIKLPNKDAWRHDGCYGQHTVSRLGSRTRYGTRDTTIGWDFIVGDRVIVTGFPFCNVSPNHRHHLVGALGEGTNYLLVPDDAVDTEVLEGRPNVRTWEDVVAAAPLPVKLKGQRAAARARTLYTVHSAAGRRETAELDTQSPIVICTALPQRHAEKYPTAQFVTLMDRQVDKFKRLYPTAVQSWEYMAEEKAKAEAALTDDDKLVAHAPASGLAFLHKREAELLDPDLCLVVNATQRTSPRAARCVLLDVAIPRPAVFDVLARRYPLIGGVYEHNRHSHLDDLLLYTQAKFMLLEDAAAA